MNIYKIKEKLEKQEKAVFSLNEIARILSIRKKIASVYIDRMKRKKLLFKIEKNKISLSSDPFIISSQLIFPAYISFTSALYLHNVFEQVIDKIYIVTSRKRKFLTVFGTKIIFVNVNSRHMFGYGKVKKENSFIMLADLEKAIIDCLIFPRYCRLNNLSKILKQANLKKLEEYAFRLNKEVVIRRLGYLLDLAGISSSLKRRTDVSYKLNPCIKKRGKFNKKWYLYVNE